MSNAASNTKGSMPPDTGLRIGIAYVDSLGVVTVKVSNKEIACGYVDPLGYADGVPVAILRGESSWLVLGAVVTQPPAAAVTVP